MALEVISLSYFETLIINNINIAVVRTIGGGGGSNTS
jgi:sulfur carrier protein ThiS